MGYVLITFFVLLFLNIYCSNASSELYFFVVSANEASPELLFSLYSFTFLCPVS